MDQNFLILVNLLHIQEPFYLIIKQVVSLEGFYGSLPVIIMLYLAWYVALEM